MNHTVINSIMEKSLKYICAVLLIIGTSTHAWATTETVSFATACGAVPTNTSVYGSGSYSFAGYAISATSVKYTSYAPAHLLLNYLSSGDHNEWGSVTLPQFSGIVSSIQVTAPSGIGDTNRYIELYVNGVYQSTSAAVQASGSYTFTSLSIAAGSTIELRNATSNNEFHLLNIVVTHNGSQLGTGTVPTGYISVNVVGEGSVAVGTNPITGNATSSLSATPAAGWAFDHWEITEVWVPCDEDNRFEWDAFDNGDVSPNSTSNNSVTLYAHNNNVDIYQVTATFIETQCSNTPVISFTNATVTKKFNAAAGAYQTASITGKGSGQTLKYTSSNTNIATINQSNGTVTLTGNLGSTTITASVDEDGDYCAASATYTLTVEGYDVTYNVESCAANKPSNLTNQKGSVTLATGLTIDGYQFVGWTTNGSYSDGNTPPASAGSSITVTADVDLYAVWKKVSSKFNKCPKNTLVTEGDYVITTNYDPSTSAVVMTNTLDGSYRMTTNGSTFTFDSEGDLSCNDEDYIWHISGSAGNWVLYNASSSKYLSANNGSTSTSDRQMRLEDAVSGDYQKWAIVQTDANTVPYKIHNKGRVSDNSSDKGLNQSSGKIGHYANTGSFYLFKRTSTSNAYTINPSCSAAEYTVTFNMASAPTGAAVTASATGATFSSPVLSPVLSEASVTIGVTSSGTGYHFDHWEVSSGGAALSSAATVASNGFTMPASNVVLTPVFTPNEYSITYLDKGGSAFSGTHDTGYPTTHTYGTATTLAGATKSGWEFAGWYTTSACTSGTQVTTLGATTYTDNITLYALWVHFTDPLAWCPEPEVVLTGTTYITSLYHASNEGMVRGAQQLTITGRNMGINEDVTITSNNANVYFSTSTYENIKRGSENQPKTTLTLKTDANGKLNGDAGYTIYVHFMPSAAGDGSISDVTVTATYAVPDPDEVSTTHVYVRSMPAQFVIAAKVGSTWYALPANMTGAGNPDPVQIAVNETSWTAQGPSTVAYAMWPVHTTSSATPSYTENGDHLRFVGNSDKGLWASTASDGYTINNYATITSIGSGTPTTAYEWQITTNPTNALDPTDGTWIYNIQSHQTNNTRYLNIKSSDIVWGTYNAGYELTKDMYLLPLTVVTPANMSVMEWGESEVAVKCAANTTLTKVTINGTEISPVSLTQICGDIYKINGGGMPNLSTLATYAMKQMVIDVEESSTAKQCVLTIPFILTNTNSPAATPQTAVALRNLATGSSQDARNDVIKSADVVVRNNAQLDVTNDESTYCTFRDLYVYPGGKVHVNTLNLGANNVYLRGGFSWLDASKDYRLPQMLVESGKTISGVGDAGHGVYYDLYLDNNMYYMMALPKDVALSAITTETGSTTFDAWVKGYSGKGRTQTPKVSGWQYAWNIAPGTHLYRGRGYEIAIKPTGSRTIGILRFPLLTATAWSDEASADTIPVKAWGVDDPNVTANNQGWNYIGNPFFTALRNTDDNGQFGTNMEIRDLVKHEEDGNWNGKYDWVTTSAVKYVTVPDKMTENYRDVKAKNYELDAFFPFFIQAKTSGTLSFTNSSRVIKASPLLGARVAAREIDIDFTLTDPNGSSDNAGLTVGNDYSAEFDMDDKEKTIVNENFLKVYTMVGEYRTAFNSLPEATAALPIPVGYIAPVDGKYIFALDEAEYAEVEHVYLTDYDKNITVDLLDAQDNAYEFEATKGTNNTRLALNIILKEEKEDPIGTGVNHLDVDSDVPIKFIYQDKMYILHRGIIYDATGKRVKVVNK